MGHVSRAALVALTALATACGAGSDPVDEPVTEERRVPFSEHIEAGADGRFFIKAGRQLRGYSPAGELLWQRGELSSVASRKSFLAADSALYNWQAPTRIEKLSHDGNVLWEFDTLTLGEDERVHEAEFAASRAADGGVFMVQLLLRSVGESAMTGAVVTRISSSGNLLWQTVLDTRMPVHFFPVTDDGLIVATYFDNWQTYRIDNVGKQRRHTGDEFRVVNAILLSDQNNLVLDSIASEFIRYSRDWVEQERYSTHAYYNVEENKLFNTATGFVSTTGFSELSGYDFDAEELWTWDDEQQLLDQASVSMDSAGRFYATSSWYSWPDVEDKFARLYAVSADGTELWHSDLPEASPTDFHGGIVLRTASAADRVYASDAYNIWGYDQQGNRIFHQANDETVDVVVTPAGD